MIYKINSQWNPFIWLKQNLKCEVNEEKGNWIFILHLFYKKACVSTRMVSIVYKSYGMILNKIILNMIKHHV